MFRDQTMERIVRKVLSKPSGELTAQDLERIEVIAPTDCAGVRDLSGLEHCKSLKKLELWDDEIRPLGGIRRIDALAELTELKELALYHYRYISDLSPLEKLTNLEVLKLPLNAIEDISVLKKLTSLRVLDLSYNPISDYSPIQGLSELVELTLTDLPDNLVFSAFPKLQTLRMVLSPTKDIKRLADAKSLTRLHIFAYRTDLDIRHLSQLEHLRVLQLEARTIRGLETLSGFKELEMLEIWSGVSEIDPHLLPASLRELRLPDPNNPMPNSLRVWKRNTN